MSNKQKRYRGIVLTTQGFKKLQEAISLSENEHNWGERYSLEQLSNRTQLSSATIRKVLNQDCLVDKNTIRIFFQTFRLELLPCDYEKPKSEILGQEENNQQDWGLAPDIANFYGQENNIATLTDWIVEKHCRLILLLGMGGSGKTFLSIKVAQLIQDQFDFIIWRSLKITNDMRSLNLVISGQEIVDDWVSFFSQSQKTNCSLRELVDYLRCHKCLLILDGLETILKSKNHQGKYEDNYATYRKLLEVFGTTFHQSCAIITSREKPENISFLEEKKGKIRSLSLKGEGFYLMNINLNKNNKSKQLTNKMSLFCEYYNNNYGFLNIITEYINSFFGGELEQFIRQETRLVNEIYSLIDEHFERLSPLERIIINEFKNEEKYINLYSISKKKQ